MMAEVTANQKQNTRKNTRKATAKHTQSNSGQFGVSNPGMKTFA